MWLWGGAVARVAAGCGQAVRLLDGGREVEAVAGAVGERRPVLVAVVEQDAAGDAVEVGREGVGEGVGAVGGRDVGEVEEGDVGRGGVGEVVEFEDAGRPAVDAGRRQPVARASWAATRGAEAGPSTWSLRHSA